MKKIVKALCILITIMMLVSILFTACGKPAATPDKAASSSQTQPEATKDTQNDTPKEIQKLTYYGFSEWVTDPKLAANYKEVADNFEKDNPGFKIELQGDPWNTWEPKYKVMFASGSAADVFLVNNPDFPAFANSDNLLDLGQYAGADYFKDFFPGVLSMYTWKGKNMGLPFTTDCRVLWYNKEIFKKAGLDPEKPPKTWAELKDYAKKCTMDTNGDGKVDVYGYGMDLGLKAFPQESLFMTTGGHTINVASDGKITPNVNTPEFKGYLQLLADMKPYYEPDFGTLDHQKVSTLFAQQKVAMITAGFWVWSVNKDMDKETFYGQAFVPKMSESSPDGSFGGGFSICVSKNTKNPEAAVKFAQALVDPKNNSRLMTDIPASNKGLAESSYGKDAKYAKFMKQIAFAGQSQPKTLYYAAIDSATYDVVTKAVFGKVNVDQAVKELEDAINNAIKK